MVIQRRLFLLLILGFVLVGCGTNIEELEGTAWRLTGDDDPSAVRTVHINYSGLTGFDGCLPWFSESDTTEAPLQISTRFLSDSGTDICSPAQKESAERFRVELDTITDIDLQGEELQLRGEDVTFSFEPVPPLDLDRLVDVEWKTKFLAASSDLYDLEGSPSFFYFASDGSFEAHTGCRPGFGTWDDQSAFASLSLMRATWDAPVECGGLIDDVDLAFTRVLSFDANAYIIDDRLFIASSDWSPFAVFEAEPG